MNLASIAQEAIDIQKRAIKMGFDKESAASLADEFLKAKITAQREEEASTNKEEQGPIFGTATQIGYSLKRKGFSDFRLGAQEVNKLLAHHGLQVKCKNGKWKPTEKGDAFAKISYMVTKVKGEYYEGSSRIRWDLDGTVKALIGEQ